MTLILSPTKLLDVKLKKTIGINRTGGQSSPSLPLIGSGSITGRVLENGLPVSRRVMLYERQTGIYAGQTRSDSDGNYTFKRTDERGVYFVISIDDSNDGVNFNLKGQDLISGNHDKLNS